MIANLARQFVELFIEQEPSDRGGEHRTLEEAIATHTIELFYRHRYPVPGKGRSRRCGIGRESWQFKWTSSLHGS